MWKKDVAIRGRTIHPSFSLRLFAILCVTVAQQTISFPPCLSVAKSRQGECGPLLILPITVRIWNRYIESAFDAAPNLKVPLRSGILDFDFVLQGEMLGLSDVARGLWLKRWRRSASLAGFALVRHQLCVRSISPFNPHKCVNISAFVSHSFHCFRASPSACASRLPHSVLCV